MFSEQEQSTEFERVTELINQYLHGLHHGDVKTLDHIFHDDVVLKWPNQRRTKQEWLEAVETREIPALSGYEFRYRILSLEILQDQAMVKVECPLFEHFYVDYLGLLKENGRWQIVNKMFTDVIQTN